MWASRRPYRKQRSFFYEYLHWDSLHVLTPLTMSPILFECCGERLWLSPGKCIFWEGQRTLVLADLHVGKAAHFRKEGIGIPQQVFQEDIQQFFHQVQFFNPERILIVGDLFHSHENKEHEWFSRWRASIQSTEVILVKGNHEILHDSAYEKLGLIVVDNQFEAGPFVFSHILPQTIQPGRYYFSGHVHPGVKLSGKGRQSFLFPCFHFTPSCCTLPAFSTFTGMHKVTPAKGDKLFAVVSATHKGSSGAVVMEV